MEPSSKALTVMAFDYGTKRIGIAIGQTVSRTATALKVIAADNGKPRWQEIAALIDEWGPDLFVVGKPAYEDQQPNPVGEEIERFSRRLRGRYNRPVEFIDERLSSFAAAQDDQAGSSGLDAAAAKMILLTWLEQPRLDRLATS
jgi:putative Holliday junction resolvase